MGFFRKKKSADAVNSMEELAINEELAITEEQREEQEKKDFLRAIGVLEEESDEEAFLRILGITGEPEEPEECLFCKIVEGEIPCNKVYEDETVLAFLDINPKATTHILVIPKEHIADCAAGINAENAAIVGHIFEVIAELANRMFLANFRVVTNNGKGAGQTVPHLHFHLLGGKPLFPEGE